MAKVERTQPIFLPFMKTFALKTVSSYLDWKSLDEGRDVIDLPTSYWTSMCIETVE
jgi:hypothetical protein